ncbi:hypothetical protein pipiens_011321 [Culex pipiens pipiens]|uniref:Uncharacterized protein n=1 Tax=Culex pipiens pipiens TaxID=38569 RepID=A0ABD1D6V1_CULPP
MPRLASFYLPLHQDHPGRYLVLENFQNQHCHWSCNYTAAENGPDRARVKIEGEYAAVKFPSLTTLEVPRRGVALTLVSEVVERTSLTTRKDDLQMIKLTKTSRLPDCFQKITRRVAQIPHLPSEEEFARPPRTVKQACTHCLFNLNTGRQEQDSVFPTDIVSFMSRNPKRSECTSEICQRDIFNPHECRANALQIAQLLYEIPFFNPQEEPHSGRFRIIVISAMRNKGWPRRGHAPRPHLGRSRSSTPRPRNIRFGRKVVHSLAV